MEDLIQIDFSDKPGLRDRMNRELHSGLQLERETEAERVRSAAARAHDHRNMVKKKSDFMLNTVLPSRDFFRLTKKYGHDEVHSREFIRHLHKKMPELRTARV